MKLISSGDVSPSIVAGLLPVWLEHEAVYANSKYGKHNPQLQALDGGLDDYTSAAFLEFHNYYGRFLFNFENAAGDELILLKANQALGKAVSASRALLRVIFEQGLGVSRFDADERTFRFAEDRLPAIREARALDLRVLKSEGAAAVDSSLRDISIGLEGMRYDYAADAATVLLTDHAQLFIDFVCETGVIARPGINSSDLDGELDHWTVDHMVN